jgi:hypothetical protein
LIVEGLSTSNRQDEVIDLFLLPDTSANLPTSKNAAGKEKEHPESESQSGCDQSKGFGQRGCGAVPFSVRFFFEECT